MTEPQAWTDERLAAEIRKAISPRDDGPPIPDIFPHGVIDLLRSDPSIGEYLRGSRVPRTRATPVYAAVLAFCHGKPSIQAADVLAEVQELGTGKQIYNAINYLIRTGRMKRRKNGRYAWCTFPPGEQP